MRAAPGIGHCPPPIATTVSHPAEQGAVESSTSFHAVSRIAIGIASVHAAGMVQLVVRLEDELAAAVDELVAAGVFVSRSEAVRVGLERLVDRCRRDEIGARIARGYRDRPQSQAEVAWADESSVRMMPEEPW